MSDLKILHAADLHLDSPFEGLGSAKAALRRSEQRDLLFRLAQLAQNEAVDIVLLSGDLLDSDSTFAETGETLSKTLGSIDAPVFIAPGNHDFYSARSPYARLRFPENVHIFKSAEPECVELSDKGTRVWGAAFTDKYSAPLLRGFSVQKSAGIRDIMCIHGEVAADSRYNAITEADIAGSNLDYLALGHIHKASGLKKAGGTYYAWPGCPEGRGFDETGDKFVYIVTLGGDCAVRPVSIAKRKYAVLPVELKSDDFAADIAEALPAGSQNDIYRIILRGETDVTPQPEKLEEALADKCFAVQVRDETRIKRDIWDGAGDDNLRGLFLKRLKKQFDAAKTDEEKEKITQAVRWGLAAIDNREEVVNHDDQKA